MDRIFQIGDFRFRISYPEEVAPPDNFMKFECGDCAGADNGQGDCGSVEYVYNIEVADSLPVPLLVTIKFRGSVSDVEAAMEAGERMAKSLTGVVQKHVIPRPTADTEKMLKLCAFDKS